LDSGFSVEALTHFAILWNSTCSFIAPRAHTGGCEALVVRKRFPFLSVMLRLRANAMYSHLRQDQKRFKN
jgi:hypothetical protein